MKIHLIHVGGKSPYIPLGIAYIAGVLRESGHDVVCMDRYVCRNDADILNAVIKETPELVGVSISTVYFSVAKRLGENIKEMLNVPIVVGGPHPSILPLEVVKEKWVDFVVVGEGEHTMLDLVKCIEENKDLRQVNGLVYKHDGRTITNKPRAPIDNLDELPFPARDLFDIKKYMYGVPEFPLPVPCLHILTSRGCPYRCLFCKPCEDLIFGNKVRFRSVDNVIDEINFLIETYGIRGLNFQDDTFTLRRKYVIELCDRLIKEGISDRISFWAQTRPDHIDEELVRKLKKAGCIVLSIGFESGSQKILDFLRKDTNVDEAEKAIKIIKRVGVMVAMGVMIGTPTETLVDLQKTYKFIRRSKPENVWVSYTIPIPGSYLYDYAKRNSLLTHEVYDETFDRCIGIGSMKREVSSETLEYYYNKLLLRWNINYRFLREPHYLKAIAKRWYSFIKAGKLEYIFPEILPKQVSDKLSCVKKKLLRYITSHSISP